MAYSQNEADLLKENNDLRAQNAELVGALQELRARLHAQGRRPEECYEMSLIDAALARHRDES